MGNLSVFHLWLEISMNRNVDWAKLRADFPILDQKVHGKPLIYFDNAATSRRNLHLSRRLLNSPQSFIVAP